MEIPDGVILKELRNGQTKELHYVDNKLQVLVINPPTPGVVPAGLKIVDKNTSISDANPWQLSLFTLPTGVVVPQPLPTHSLVDVYDLFELKEEKTVTVEGRELVYLHFQSQAENRDYKVYIDKRVNWLIVRCQLACDTKSDLGVFNYDCSATDFREIKPGLFAPTRCSVSFSGAKLPAITHQAVIKKIKINDDSIQLHNLNIPNEGLIVLDETLGISYQMNSTKQRVGEISKLGKPADGIVPPTPGEPK